MPDADLIERALRALLDSPDVVDLDELIQAHYAAQYATSGGDLDAHAVHERDALCEVVARELAERMPVPVAAAQSGRAAA